MTAGPVIVNGVRVNFEYIGEGHSGDYNASDPADEPLLRLDVNLAKGYYPYDGEDADDGWIYPDQGSICTQVRDGVVYETEVLLLTYAACFIDRECRHGRMPVKRMMDVLSYLPDIRYIEERREAFDA